MIFAKRSSPIRKYFQRYTQDVEMGLGFCEWLAHHSFDFGFPSISWNHEVFRIIYRNYDPLSISGSLAAGGRFNIGGAQKSQFFPNLPMQACLYAASSIECAFKEAGEPLGDAQVYALKPQNKLHLWDLHFLVVNILDYPGLKAHIDATPLAAIWAYQKVPKISQIIASHLRAMGGDGLIYPSTKDPNGEVFAFFAKDDREMQGNFKIRQVKI